VSLNSAPSLFVHGLLYQGISMDDSMVGNDEDDPGIFQITVVTTIFSTLKSIYLGLLQTHSLLR